MGQPAEHSIAVTERRRLLLLAALAVLLVASAVTVWGRQGRAAAGPASQPGTRVVTLLDQAPVDLAPQAPPPPAAAAAAPQPAPSAGSATATVTAFIPPRTFVRVDGEGRPVEAMTNTGRSPGPGDQFFVEGDGPARPLDDATAATVVERASGGDWSQVGRWHALG
jgi:hypothetical protein